MLRIADKTFESHLFTGTGKFAAPEVMVEAIRASGSQLVTLAMKRVDLRQRNDAILAPLLAAGVNLLPNTSGAKTAEEAVFAARLAREALGTHWSAKGSWCCPAAAPIRCCVNDWKRWAARR